jgi:hypothetical protein
VNARWKVNAKISGHKHQVPATTSNDMPFGVAIVLLFVGTGLFFSMVLGWVAPALWIHFAYRPSMATVLETRPTERHVKGSHGVLRGLEARIGVSHDGRMYDRWVKLPHETHEREGPEAEAVRNQVVVGQRVPCFRDPRSPRAGIVLERTRLEWGLLLAPIFALLFVGGGCAGVISSLNKTFEGGSRVAVFELARRLPRPFYATVLGAALVLSAAWLTMDWGGPSLGGWGLLVILGTGAAMVILIRQSARYASVAFPSPERRGAHGFPAGHPETAKALVEPAPVPWVPAHPIKVDRGKQLRVRLQPDPVSMIPVGAGCVPFVAVGVIGLLVVGLLGRVAGQSGLLARPPALLVFGLAGAAGILTWRWTTRRIQGLTVELSDHPLRAGGQYQISVAHVDSVELSRLSFKLICQEESATGGARGGKHSFRETSSRRVVPLEPGQPPFPGNVRRARLDIAPDEVPSMALRNHWIDWFITVRLGGWTPWTVRYPVRIAAASPCPAVEKPTPLRRKVPEARRDEEYASLWINGGSTIFYRSERLCGGYTINAIDGGTLESVELSVLWQTAGKGTVEIGVCHYEAHAAIEGDDLPLHGTRSFQTRLPDGPPSHEGTIVKIRWLTRLRLRYADGIERLCEIPIQLI